MKKLMTMLSAATVAIGLYAYDDTGTSFEGATVGEFDLNTADDLGAATGYWGSDTNTWTVVEGTSIGRTIMIGEENAFPDQFQDETQGKYLKVASAFGNPLTRYVNSDKISGVNTEDAPLYFDSLVKFTAFDYGDLPTQVTNELESAKIAVWIQAIDEDGTQTNLYVRAGKLAGNGVDAYTYDCGQFDNADAWHRLTIKAMGSIYQNETAPGFAVFVDNAIRGTADATGIDEAKLSGECYGFYTQKGLFPSMDQASAKNTMITSVSFDGQGDVDDVVFTQALPFDAAKSSEIATITWDSDTSHITSFTIDGTVYSSGTAQINFTPDGQGEMSVILEGITYADGWTGPASKEITIDDSKAFVLAGIAGEIVAYFNDAAYTNLTEAVDAADASETPGTLKLYKTTGTDDIAFDTAASVTIDLNGQTIGGIDATGTAVAITNSSDVVGVVSDYVALGDGSSIAGGKFEDEVAFADGATITGGAFASGSNDAETLTAFAPEGYKFVEGTDEYEGYLVLAEKGEVTEIAVPTAATGLVYDGTEQTGVEAGQGYELTGTAAATDAGKYTATATLEDGYAWVGGSTDATNIVWSIAAKTDAEVVVTLTSEIEEYTAQIAFPTVSATIGNGVVAGTPVWDPATITEPEAGATNTYTVTFTVTTANYAGSTGTATFRVWKAPSAGGEYPSYIDGITDPETKAAYEKKYDTWATTYSVADGEYSEEAFLLNCDPANVEAAKENFKIPSITVDAEGNVTVGEIEGSFNGKLQLKGSNDLSNWTNIDAASKDYNFFKYELTF